ncbi:hypothetical protein ABW20_dc0101396 [Dactylellina cionopaga]|nr:hypothetical protein ABW20_dc0101396 [Dactylellina cionopaga]
MEKMDIILPIELLAEIANQSSLTTQDLTNLACVNHRFHEVACARLYRSGELSYVGATDKDTRKVEAFGKNGKFVRILSLNLFSRSTSRVSIPTAIFPLLSGFVNLHSVTIIDTASLTWPDFLHVLAIIITSHPYLKHLEIQRTFTTLDGRADVSKAFNLLDSHQKKYNLQDKYSTTRGREGVICKLDTFTLRLAKKEDPHLISRTALNNLITLLLPATRSAKAFTYATEANESADIDLKDSTTGEDAEPLSWEWDNLESLTLKLPVRPFTPDHNQQQQVLNGRLVNPGTNMSFQKDLHNVKKLSLRVRAESLGSLGHLTFVDGLQSMPNLERIRLSHTGGYLDWDPRSRKDHPFVKLAEAVPKLEVIEQTDPYYMTRVIQAWRAIREDGEITFKPVDRELEAWDSYWEPPASI